MKTSNAIRVLTICLCALVGDVHHCFAQTIRVPAFKIPEAPAGSKPAETPASQKDIVAPAQEGVHKLPCWLFPTHCMNERQINAFYGTAGSLSYFNQIKSIYNGASGSATVSADLASLNFSNGMQVTAATNIQAGSSNSTPISSGGIASLSSSAAAQATQNMLYGGTVVSSALYPLFVTGTDKVSSSGGISVLVDLVAREGVDLQNFKSGTSVNVNAPNSHASAQIEGYLQYNSINLAPGSTNYLGAIFIGGSYGYSYTSHGYARDYGFGNKVSNGIGQISAGILISGVAKISVSRAFGPSQTYIDSTSMARTTLNNFKSWSFGIAYQSPPPSNQAEH